jgi:hypothetical protein
MQGEEIIGGRPSENRTSENSSINTWYNVDSYVQKYKDRWERYVL